MTVFQAILEKIKAYDTIIIHRHQRPDPDAIGSQVGLKEILKTNFPDKKVLATGVNEPTLSWIAEMDEVAKRRRAWHGRLPGYIPFQRADRQRRSPI